MNKFGLDVWTSKLAIGSVCLVSLFLGVCGFYNIFPWVEALSSSSTWEIIVAIPILVVSYALGALVIYCSTSIRNQLTGFDELGDFISISRCGNNHILTRYEQLKHELEFFEACIPTTLLLSISVCWSAARVLRFSPNEMWVSIVLALCILGAIPLLLRMSNQIRTSMVRLAKEADEIRKQKYD